MPILGIMASQISGHLWAPSGAYDALATVTVPSGGAASIEFVGIPTGYKHLQIRWIAQTNRGTFGFDDLKFNFNSDTSSLYTFHTLYGNGASAVADAGINANAARMYNGAGTQVSGTWWAAGVADLLDYADTNKFKTMRTLVGCDLNGNSPGTLHGRMDLFSNLYRSTTAISSVTIASDTASTFQQYTSFALYGVK
jgi:hypothetical protein